MRYRFYYSFTGHPINRVRREYELLTEDGSMPENVLFSAAVHLARAQDLYELVGLSRDFGVEKVMIDSGGFSASLKTYRKVKFDPVEITQLQLDLGADYGIQLDVPLSDHLDVSARLQAIKKTGDNYAEIVENFGGAELDRILPTIHGWTLEEVRTSCRRILELNPSVKYVSMGSLVPFFKRNFKGFSPMRAIQLIQETRRFFPTQEFHALGVGLSKLPILQEVGVTSTDSSRAHIVAQKNRVFVIRNNTTKAVYHKPGMRSPDIHKLENCDCVVCRMFPVLDERLEKFVEVSWDAARYRVVHNIHVMHELEMRYRRMKIKDILRDYGFRDLYLQLFGRAEGLGL